MALFERLGVEVVSCGGVLASRPAPIVGLHQRSAELRADKGKVFGGNLIILAASGAVIWLLKLVGIDLHAVSALMRDSGGKALRFFHKRLR